MTAAARKPTTNPIKRGLIGKVHVAKAQLGLAEEDYRAILARVTGKDSAARCSVSELEAIVREFERLGWEPRRKAPKRAGKRPLADGEEARKLRALWLAGYHLGVVQDPREEALSAFVKRVTGGRRGGVDALQWLDQAGAAKAIEGLKAWLARPVDQGGAGVDWAPYRRATPQGIETVHHPRRRVVEAQARLLGRTLREIEAAGHRLTGKAGFAFYADADWDRLIAGLGDPVRSARGNR